MMLRISLSLALVVGLMTSPAFALFQSFETGTDGWVDLQGTATSVVNPAAATDGTHALELAHFNSGSFTVPASGSAPEILAEMPVSNLLEFDLLVPAASLPTAAPCAGCEVFAEISVFVKGTVGAGFPEEPIGEGDFGPGVAPGFYALDPLATTDVLYHFSIPYDPSGWPAFEDLRLDISTNAAVEVVPGGFDASSATMSPVFIDSVSVSFIPEPTSIAMLLFGAAMLAVRRRV